MVSWTCVCGPAGVPAPVVNRMSALTKQALETPALIRAYADLGASAWWTSMEDMASYRTAQKDRLAPLIRASGAQVD
ncbi:MAG: hypothetical protein EON47_18805 [Acetobacteraceae bacterium]|nr:MAG: hypothetical protein EON47_18805 [Acetobacteraceae bacterium]